MPTNIAINLNAGDFRSNVVARSFGDRYWIGSYITGPAEGDVHGEHIGAFQRATYQVLAEPDYTRHLGVSADELIKAPQNNSVAPATVLTVGSDGKTVTSSTVPSPYSIALSDQPELRIDTTTFANTGTLGTLANPVNRRAGLRYRGGRQLPQCLRPRRVFPLRQ